MKMNNLLNEKNCFFQFSKSVLGVGAVSLLQACAQLGAPGSHGMQNENGTLQGQQQVSTNTNNAAVGANTNTNATVAQVQAPEQQAAANDNTIVAQEEEKKQAGDVNVITNASQAKTQEKQEPTTLEGVIKTCEKVADVQFKELLMLLKNECERNKAAYEAAAATNMNTIEPITNNNNINHLVDYMAEQYVAYICYKSELQNSMPPGMTDRGTHLSINSKKGEVKDESSAEVMVAQRAMYENELFLLMAALVGASNSYHFELGDVNPMDALSEQTAKKLQAKWGTTERIKRYKGSRPEVAVAPCTIL